MEEKDIQEEIILQESGYKERPRWQVWAARVGLVIVIIGVALYYYHIAKGGI